LPFDLAEAKPVTQLVSNLYGFVSNLINQLVFIYNRRIFYSSQSFSSSSRSLIVPLLEGGSNLRNCSSIHPYWITGFTDAEGEEKIIKSAVPFSRPRLKEEMVHISSGSFVISLAKHKSKQVGYSINPSFQIKLNIRDLELLKIIQEGDPPEGGGGRLLEGVEKFIQKRIRLNLLYYDIKSWFK